MRRTNITSELAAQIKREYQQGTTTLKQLGAKYGISEATVCRIINSQWKPRPTDEERFWSNVDTSDQDGCWSWLAAKDKKGYGKFKINGKAVRTHRVAFIFANGYEPETGLVVRHTCNNKSCVNPSHLIQGTNEDNAIDSTTKPEQSLEMCCLYDMGWTVKQISQFTGLCSTTVKRHLTIDRFVHLARWYKRKQEFEQLSKRHKKIDA